MTAPAVDDLPTADDAREELSLQARVALCRRFFPAFLQFVRIEDEAAKANGVPGGIVPMEMWPHIVRLAYEWEEGGHGIILKARQVGLSILLASLGAHRGGIQGKRVLVISKTGGDAVELAQRIRTILANLPDELRPRTIVDNQQELRFANGGHIRVLAPTEVAGRGFTASLVIVDEAAFHPFAETNYAAYEPVVARARGQILMVSTANGASNFFARQFRRAWAGEGKFTAHFLSWWLTPDRQLPDGSPNYEWRESKRDDYPSAARFLAEYAGSIEEAFTTREGLVYGVDQLGRHIFSRKPYTNPQKPDECGNLSPDPCDWNDCLYHLWGYDPGGGDPTALGFYGVLDTGRVHKFGEWHREGSVSLQDVALVLQEWAPEKGWTLGVIDSPQDSDRVATLSAMGYPCVAARKDRTEGIDTTTMFLLQRRLTFNEQQCPQTMLEFGSYIYAETTDSTTKQRYQTRTPVNHHGDHMDEMRYVVMAVHHGDIVGAAMRQPRKAYSSTRW